MFGKSHHVSLFAWLEEAHLMSLIVFVFGFRVGITLPTVEVRFEDLAVKTECYVGNRAIPTLTNTVRNLADMAFGLFGIGLSKKRKLTILDNVSGMIKPSRYLILMFC